MCERLGLGVLGEELAERPVHGDLVARLEVEHPGRHLPRRQVAARRRRGDADVELDHALLFRVVGHRVGADHRLVDLRHVAPHVELVPVAAIFRLDIEVLVLDHVRRAFQLHVAAGTKVHALAVRQAQGEFLDEGGDVGVGLHRALPFLHPEDLFRHADLHILLDRRLARQAPAFLRLAPGEVRLLGGQHLAAALDHHAFALRAGAAAAAGGRQEHVVRRQGLQQLAAGRHGQAVLAVDLDGHVATRHQLGAGDQDDRHQAQDDGGEHADGQENLESDHGPLLTTARRRTT